MKNMKQILILAAAALFLNSACRQKINEIYLIPGGFSGNIAVVFDVKQGEREVLENGSRVYRIPADGILITQANFNKTIHDEKYFFVDGYNRIPIPGTFFADAEEVRRNGLSDDDVFVRFNGGAGGVNSFSYSRHYVGSRKEMDASTEDFDIAEPAGLNARIESKVKKLMDEKILK